MDQRIEFFLADVLALAGEAPDAICEAVRVALADCEAARVALADCEAALEAGFALDRQPISGRLRRRRRTGAAHERARSSAQPRADPGLASCRIADARSGAADAQRERDVKPGGTFEKI